MNGIIDRFEGEYVVIEIEGQTEDVHKSAVESNAVIGDCVILIDGKWTVEHERTAARTAKLQTLMDEVWEDD